MLSFMEETIGCNVNFLLSSGMNMVILGVLGTPHSEEFFVSKEDIFHIFFGEKTVKELFTMNLVLLLGFLLQLLNPNTLENFQVQIPLDYVPNQRPGNSSFFFHLPLTLTGTRTIFLA